MFQIVEGNTHALKDVEAFVELINDPPNSVAGFFHSSADILIARAPGRLDVMGGIADYSGSLVMPMPIAEATFAAVQKNSDSSIKIISLAGDGNTRRFLMNISDLGLAADGYENVRRWFADDDHWASYIAGAFFALQAELGIDFQTGARVLISSDVPIGKGVSSSAALEVSTMQAVCAAFEIEIEPRNMAIMCQLVENKIVGAACGIMDQIAVHSGVANSLVSLVCQPASIGEPVPLPDGLEVWGIDSGVRHAVVGSDYSSVRVAAFMGYRIITDLAGLTFERICDGIIKINDDLWNGYLSNVTPDEYERELAGRIPISMTGREFLEKYIGTTDTVAAIDPERSYAIKPPTEHAIYENYRVNQFASLLKKPIDDATLEKLGELMFASHAGYASCGLNESGTDRIVELVRERRDKGLFGARITGGGSGGTVAILSSRRNRSAILEVAGEYQRDTGKKPYIFNGSSPGCATFGHLRLSSASVEPAVLG